MRIILCSGKGGVGKTSVAAATAVLSAEFGHKTIAFSTDTAHSLSDSFDVALGPSPTRILENLWGQEIEMSHTLQVHWETVHRWLSALLAWRGIEGIVAEDMAILPGKQGPASDFGMAGPLEPHLNIPLVSGLVMLTVKDGQA